MLGLANVLAGPFCIRQLGLIGAEVVKVEAPAEDLARLLGTDVDLNEQRMGASFLAQNGGNKSIALDLKSTEGREAFLRLVETAQVVVESFRPRRLGLGYARAVEAELETRKGRRIPMNIDGATAAVFCELGFAPQLGRGLFVLSRSVGILAHAWEQTVQSGRIKGPAPPQASYFYTGSALRKLPTPRISQGPSSYQIKE